MTTIDKLAQLRRAMLEAQIDAYIIPSTDPHQSEYPAPRWAAREWVSGFTGSAGTLVVTLHEAKLWTDSRYFLQANTQLEGTGIEMMKSRQPDSWQTRLQRFSKWMEERNLDYFVVSALDEVAWLLNIRGSDIDFNPLCVAYLVIGRKGDHALFTSPRPGFSAWVDGLPTGQKMEVHDYAKVSSYLRRLNALNADIGIDPGTISSRLAMHAGDDKTTEYVSPVPGWKAIKNDVSLEHLRTTMAHDAVALLRLRRWLDGAIEAGVTEALKDCSY